MSETLSPEILACVRRALDEDIGAGDATTDSIVPADATSSGRIIAKQAGVVAGLDVAAAAYRLVDARVSFTPLVAEGAQVANRQPLADGRRPGARPAHRRADRAQLPGPHVGHRHADAAVRRCRGRDARRDPRHAQDRAGPAHAGQAGRAPRRRTKPPHRPLRHDPDQGQPHRLRRVAGRGGAPARREPRPNGHSGLEIEVEARTLEDVRCRARSARGAHPARQHDARHDARRGRSDTLVAPSWKRRAMSRWTMCGRWPRPAWTSSPSAR